MNTKRLLDHAERSCNSDGFRTFHRRISLTASFMPLTAKIRNVLRGLKQRWGNFGIKRKLWDSEYAGGRWDHCEHTLGAHIYEYVERHCMGGSILDLGCGSGNTGNELDINKYHDYTGIDISEVAIKKAAARSQCNGRAHKSRYVHGDIISYVPDRKHDVIMLRESIYYIPHLKMRTVLDRYSGCLTEHGVFVVHVSNHATKKGRRILDLIERNYEIVDGNLRTQSDGFIVVFRRNKAPADSHQANQACDERRCEFHKQDAKDRH